MKKIEAVVRPSKLNDVKDALSAADLLEGAEEMNPRKLRVDPLMPGVSIGHHLGTAGTLGLVVFDRDTGDDPWHVPAPQA